MVSPPSPPEKNSSRPRPRDEGGLRGTTLFDRSPQPVSCPLDPVTWGNDADWTATEALGPSHRHGFRTSSVSPATGSHPSHPLSPAAGTTYYLPPSPPSHPP